MRHKYETRGIVLSRAQSGEANALLTLITPELGIVRARAQGLRRAGAKLAPALATFAESDAVLVRGREHWRISGAVLAENWFARMRDAAPRERAGRISHLLLRLAPNETNDHALFPILKAFFDALAALHEQVHEAAEILAALRILAVLGFDAGDLPKGMSVFDPLVLAEIAEDRTRYIARINQGIAASGL